MFNEDCKKRVTFRKRVLALVLAMSMLLGISLFAFAYQQPDEKYDAGIYIEGENSDDAQAPVYGGAYDEDTQPPYGVYPPVGGGSSRRK